MAHPYDKQAKTGQQIAKARYADGGATPLKDLPDPNGGMKERLDDETANRKDELSSTMYSGPGVNDRFYDTGTRIPGRQKARNDDYSARLKAR